MSEYHLMDKHKFEVFCDEMWAELVKHMDEKMSLKDAHPHEVREICLKEIIRRYKIMAMGTPAECIIQSKHIANYMFFLNIKMREIYER